MYLRGTNGLKMSSAETYTKVRSLGDVDGSAKSENVSNTRRAVEWNDIIGEFSAEVRR